MLHSDKKIKRIVMKHDVYRININRWQTAHTSLVDLFYVKIYICGQTL